MRIKELRKYKRLPAFTLMECLVVMVLTALISGLSYTIFNIINTQAIRYTNSAELMLDLSKLDEALSKDISQSDNLFRGSNSIAVSQDISYSFYPWGIVRAHSARQDTFYLKAAQYDFLFQGVTVAEGELLDEFRVNSAGFNTTYKKKYSASDLMNLHLAPDSN